MMAPADAFNAKTSFSQGQDEFAGLSTGEASPSSYQNALNANKLRRRIRFPVHFEA